MNRQKKKLIKKRWMCGNRHNGAQVQQSRWKRLFFRADRSQPGVLALRISITLSSINGESAVDRDILLSETLDSAV